MNLRINLKMLPRINSRLSLLVILVLVGTLIYVIKPRFKSSEGYNETSVDLMVKAHNLQSQQLKSNLTLNRVKACFVILIRNSDLKDWRKSMRQLEDRFNHKFNYPYVFLNDAPFSDEFKEMTQALTSATVEFATIPHQHWSIPDSIDKAKAKSAWQKMEKDNVIYGGSESYRHMCRFESGFFFQQEVTKKYDYYWRVEPGVEFGCDIDFDPFAYLHDNGMKYGFTQSLHEYQSTIPTLWKSVRKWADDRKLWHQFPKDNSLAWISDDLGSTYNGCHFWSNFEIASFDLWRDSQYLDFFNFLDNEGGFFYERWGDAPVHSIYAALTLPRSQIHFFNEIGYYHGPFWHCPVDRHLQHKCHCDPKDNFDLNDFSCNKPWFDLNHIKYSN